MSDEGHWYLDASALVKLVIAEPETASLRADLLKKPRRVGSELLFVEVPRSVMGHGADATFLARQLVQSLTTLIPIDHELLDRAAQLPPAVLRSLDAIHLASALRLGSDLAGMVTYDHRLAGAATGIGIEVVSPGR